MIFDHEKEVGAFLFLNLKRKVKDILQPMIEGYLYRHEPVMGVDPEQGPEQVELGKRWYIMGVDGIWKEDVECTNPYFHNLAHFLSFGSFTGDRSEINWGIYADFLADTAPRMRRTEKEIELEIDYYDLSEGWIRKALLGDIQVELDKIEYDVGDKK